MDVKAPAPAITRDWAKVINRSNFDSYRLRNRSRKYHHSTPCFDAQVGELNTSTGVRRSRRHKAGRSLIMPKQLRLMRV